MCRPELTHGCALLVSPSRFAQENASVARHESARLPRPRPPLPLLLAQETPQPNFYTQTKRSLRRARGLRFVPSFLFFYGGRITDSSRRFIEAFCFCCCCCCWVCLFFSLHFAVFFCFCFSYCSKNNFYEYERKYCRFKFLRGKTWRIFTVNCDLILWVFISLFFLLCFWIIGRTQLLTHTFSVP